MGSTTRGRFQRPSSTDPPDPSRRSPLHAMGLAARWRAARAVDAAWDRWGSYAGLGVGVLGAVAAAAAWWLY